MPAKQDVLIEIPGELTYKDILAFKPLSDAFDRERGVKAPLTVKLVVTQNNYKDLSVIVAFLKTRKVTGVQFSQVMVTGSLSTQYHLLVPTQEMTPYLSKAIKEAVKAGMACTFESLPLCILPGQEDRGILNLDPGIKMQFCVNCEFNKRCGGITKAQLVAAYGTQLLSWQFLFPKNFFSDDDIAFLDEQLLKSVKKA